MKHICLLKQRLNASTHKPDVDGTSRIHEGFPAPNKSMIQSTRGFKPEIINLRNVQVFTLIKTNSHHSHVSRFKQGKAPKNVAFGHRKHFKAEFRIK